MDGLLKITKSASIIILLEMQVESIEDNTSPPMETYVCALDKRNAFPSIKNLMNKIFSLVAD